MGTLLHWEGYLCVCLLVWHHFKWIHRDKMMFKDKFSRNKDDVMWIKFVNDKWGWEILKLKGQLCFSQVTILTRHPFIYIVALSSHSYPEWFVVCKQTANLTLQQFIKTNQLSEDSNLRDLTYEPLSSTTKSPRCPMNSTHSELLGSNYLFMVVLLVWLDDLFMTSMAWFPSYKTWWWKVCVWWWAS